MLLSTIEYALCNFQNIANNLPDSYTEKDVELTTLIDRGIEQMEELKYTLECMLDIIDNE